MMTVYSGPVFGMAVNQFGVIANHLETSMNELDLGKVAALANWRGLFR